MAAKKGKEVARSPSPGGETYSRRALLAENVNGDRAGSSSVAVDAGVRFDENLWGRLQHHMCLAENVYSKLPFEEFFNLRTVCKDWYNIACKRLGLKEGIRKPYFPLFTKGIFGPLEGVLFYMSTCWKWRVNWSCQPGGLVFCSGNQCVVRPPFYTNLPPPPIPQNDNEKTIFGIMCIDPGNFAGKFENMHGDHKIVLASQGVDTQVYDSETRKWQTKPCRPKPETSGKMQASIGSAHCNGRVYITSEHTREVFVYDFKIASWSSLKSPCKWISNQQAHYCLDTLGVWNGRVFDVAEDSKPGSYVQGSLCVWRLVDETTHKWEVYDRLPKDLYSWLRSDQGFHLVSTIAADVTVQASFSGDYVVVCSWDFISSSAGRFCLFNMATKNWQKLEVPATRVVTRAYSDSDDSDDDSSLSESDDMEALWEMEYQFPFGSSSDEFIAADGFDSDTNS